VPNVIKIKFQIPIPKFQREHFLDLLFEIINMYFCAKFVFTSLTKHSFQQTPSLCSE